MKKVFIFSNTRMILISLLINEIDFYNDIFIFDNDIPRKIASNFGKNVIFVERSKTILELFLKKIKYFIFFRKLYKKLDLSLAEVYGADHIMGAKFFLKRNSFYLIEDGTENYQAKNYIRTWKNRLFSIPSFGMYKNVKNIYLTHNNLENIPEKLHKKIQLINIHSLWNELSEDKKKWILVFFGIKEQILFKLNYFSFILFTQPLSEDGIVTEEEKIEIYKKILSYYPLNKVIIKPHPREETNYSLFFRQAFILENYFPSELLELLNLDVDKVITLFSTAVYIYDQEKIDFYGTKIHPKLYKFFGNIEYK